MTENSNIFYSRRDKWLGFLIWAPMMTILVWMFIIDDWIGVIIIAVNLLPIYYIWFETKYIIVDELLLIKIGRFTFHTIKIKEIIHVKNSHSWLSAPANSLVRLEIKYSKWRKMIVSPENEWLFIEKIKLINPDIDNQTEKK